MAALALALWAATAGTAFVASADAACRVELDCTSIPDDGDNDLVEDALDNCPAVANRDQADMDSDGTGDACDPDRDGDGVDNGTDNCPDTANSNQADQDRDSHGDACDADRDGDGVQNGVDNCPTTANAGQGDIDGDGLGDACDADRDGDGAGLIAFSSNPAEITLAGIFAMAFDGSGVHAIGPGYVRGNTVGAADYLQPSWSPDGKRVAFARRPNWTVYDPGAVEIYTMARDGSDLRRLTNSPGWDSQPAWSPDGKRIAFLSDRDGGRELYTMAADGSDQRRLTETLNWEGAPTWSPDASRISYGFAGDIYSIAADGTDAKNLTKTSFHVEGAPDWSPDGTRIAYEWRHHETPYPVDIATMAADGSDQRRFVWLAGEHGEPSWSPDGTRIAFASTEGGSKEIWTMAANGSDRVQLTPDPTNLYEDLSPDWAGYDNCPSVANPHQEDADRDAKGDACDPVFSEVPFAGEAPDDSDIAPPAFSIGSPVAGSSTADTTPAIAGTSDLSVGDIMTVTAWFYSGANVSPATSRDQALQRLELPISNAGAWSGEPTALPVGSYTVVAVMRDLTGHSTTRTVSFTIVAPDPGSPATTPAAAADPQPQQPPPPLPPSSTAGGGGTPPVTTAPVSCVVPKLTGKRLPAAKKAIAAAGCRVGKVKRARSRKKAGTVLKQSRRPGKRLAHGTRINLVVAKRR